MITQIIWRVSPRKIGIELVRARSVLAARKLWLSRYPRRAPKVINAYAYEPQAWEKRLHILSA